MENIPVIADYKIVRALSWIAARQIKYIQRPFNGSPQSNRILRKAIRTTILEIIAVIDRSEIRIANTLHR